ncbi:MAG TPA: efflux RND transporter permease subunit, partial [Blastocatellia bacterium]|nr:efflux RND transporter permease subunit [Blastocatellia bacterium]
IPRSATAEQLRALKDAVTNDPLYARHYVSTDGRTAAINVFISDLDEKRSVRVAEQVEATVRAAAGSDEALLGGVPIVDARAIDRMVRDMGLTSPIAFLLCFLVFLLSFRSFWGAALPMAALLMGLVWTVGLMRLFDRPMTFATIPLPTVLLVVGGSYLFHVLNQYRISMAGVDELADAESRRAAWQGGLRFIGPAILVSGTTTMAGFGALAVSSIPTARDMGLFEAAGVLFMLLLSLGFLPAALALLPPRALGHTKRDQGDYAAWLNPILHHLTALVLFRRRGVLAVFLLLTALIGVGTLRMRVNTDYLRIFPESSDVVQWAEKLGERLAGVATVQVVVSGAPGAAAESDFLKGLAALEEYALRQPGVGAAVSVADLVRRLNSALRQAEEIPADSRLTRSMFDDYLSQEESIYRLISRDRSQAALILKTDLYSSNELRGLTERLEEWARANLPAEVTVRATGSTVLLNDASDAVASSQVWSLTLALAAIYLMMAALFRSFATGLLALLPNLLPIVCYFGFLGWAGIPLDITTSLIASAALGLAVDNAVHMIRRYRQCRAERGQASPEDEGWALWLTMLRTGKPMALANVMLIAAYLIFVLSSFVPVRTGGILWALTILACLVADLIFLPALMKTKWFARAALGGRRQEHEQPVEPQAAGSYR